MKRLFSFSLVVALSLLLASCDRSKTASGVLEQSAAEQAAERAAALEIGQSSAETSSVVSGARAGYTLTVISPTAKSVWKPGKTYTIRWKSVGWDSGWRVGVSLHKNLRTVKSNISGLPKCTYPWVNQTKCPANDGSYRWKIPSKLVLGDDYRIMVQMLSSTLRGPYTAELSDEFSVSKTGGGGGGGGSSDTLKIISPNGGESWKPGKRYTIKWNKGSAGAFVKIQLLKSGRAYKTITGRTTNDGNHPWTVPSTITAGSQYKIKITSTTKNTVFDASDQNFTISKTGGGGGGGTTTLKVSSPNGGESWKPGKRYTIKWNKGSAGAFVRIFLQKSGRRYKTISQKTANDGQHPWTVPKTVASGSAYKIRVQSVTKSTVKDDSDSNFTIGKAGGGTLPSGDYRFLNKYNAYQLSGHTLRWKSKTIQVSGASGSWRAAVNRWRPAVKFKYVSSKPAAGKGIQIAGYANTGDSCGLANWSYYSNGEMATCRVRIDSNYDEDSCGPEGDTIAHEIGHCIGFFKHTSDGGLMDATAACLPDCDITSPVRKMVNLLYRLSPGTNINSKLSRRSVAMRRPKDSKYDPAGTKIYYGSSHFLPNGVVKIVEGW